MTRAVFDLEGRKVWVAGHTGMVGSALLRRLRSEPVEVVTVGSDDVDLRRQEPTEAFVESVRPDVVMLAAARAGGILANTSYQAQFLYDNLMIAANVVEAAHRFGVGRTVLLGSSCIYPRGAPQPIAEDALLTGPLEPTNEGYAIAKIAALELGKMYQRQYGMDVISLMPTNLYGPNDGLDPELAHVLPALMLKVHEAKVSGSSSITVWGTGTPRREFLHVDDLADAVVFATKHYSGESHLNVGVGDDISILDLARLIADVVGWEGEFELDGSKPDGMARKLLDVSALTKLGWTASIPLREGIAATYEAFLGQAG
jgi:GDP-L-fucose synthase